MSARSVCSCALALSALLFVGAGSDKTLATVGQAPAGLPTAVAAAVNPQGYSIKSGDETVCEVWLLKNLALRPKFKPSLSVKYPFTSGELVGVLRVGNKGDYTDFRGQPVKPGVYTLRYGKQPQDGNHIGTSELADFLVAIPAAQDTDPQPLLPPTKLHKASATTVGGNHPAIFSLMAPQAKENAASLAKDDNDRWVLDVPAQGIRNGKKIPLSLRLVVIGKTAG